MADGHKAARSGRWHSAHWWRGHNDLRDDCGSFSGLGAEGCARDDGKQAQRKHDRAMQAENARHERDRKAKAPSKPTGRRAQLREDTRTARHAQVLREEHHAMGYKAEAAGFYGSAKHAPADHVESRLTVAQADAEARKQAEGDREQAAAYRARKLGRPAPAGRLYRPIRKAP